jgi:hypothetical protein
LSCGCTPAGTGTPTDDHGDARHVTLLILQGAADAAGIPLPEAAANIVASLDPDAMVKAETVEGPALMDAIPGPVLKSEPERRYTLMLAWPAMKPDVAKAADGRRDYARPEVVEKTAWAWMAKSRSVGLFHQDGTEGHGTVVESYIWRGPDWRVGDTLIKAGDWLCGVVWNEQAWALVKRGLINGMSPQGTASRAPADPSLTFDR